MTIREIAKALGVSPTAVSFVLNDRPGVGPETRARIRACLEENGYEIRRNAPPAPALRHIKFIKLRANYQNDDFTVRLLDAVERRAARCGYHVSLASLTLDADLSDLFSTERESIDGIIFLASSFTQSYLKRTMQLPFPAVYLDFEEDPDNFYRVNTINADNYHASYLALRHLFSLGHRRIGYLKSVQQIGCLKQRFQYVRQHLASLGGELAHVAAVDLARPDLEDLLFAQFRGKEDLPTAYIAENDLVAVHALRALDRLGYRVPGQISLIGFDNSQASALVRPQLSTIDVNVEEMAGAAVDRLLQLIEGPRAATHINVGVRLVKRASTGQAE